MKYNAIEIRNATAAQILAMLQAMEQASTKNPVEGLDPGDVYDELVDRQLLRRKDGA